MYVCVLRAFVWAYMSMYRVLHARGASRPGTSRARPLLNPRDATNTRRCLHRHQESSIKYVEAPGEYKFYIIEK